MSAMIDETLGKYKIISQLGTGGMGQVYKAYHPALERHVAIKILHPGHAGDPDSITRFKREAAAVAQLRHPNIVQVHDFDVVDDTYYMVMELIDGPTLKDKLYGQSLRTESTEEEDVATKELKRLRLILDKRFDDGELRDLAFELGITYEDLPGGGQGDKARELVSYLNRRQRIPALLEVGRRLRPDVEWTVEADEPKGISESQPVIPLPLVEVEKVFASVAGAIVYAHARNILHLDLKPANIVFNSSGEAMITDFGIARVVGDNRYDRRGGAFGTPGYMSPEQFDGESDERSDIYSMGMILYEMVTGQLPFKSDNFYDIIQQRLEPPTPPSTFKADLPPALERVILKALSHDPDGRYQSAREMARAVRRIITGVTTGSLKKSPAPFQALPVAPHFTGREQTLSDFAAALTDADRPNLYCLTGMGGIGKTTLAARLAQQLRDYFTDGVLWADMVHTTPEVVLDSWAREFDLDLSDLPNLSSRTALLRSELAGKKILFVLDDVWKAEEVRPLLLVGLPAVVLLTTRNTDIAAAIDGRNLPVLVLEPGESRQLLTNIIGEERVTAEPEVADEIGRLLGYLPLAIKLAAQRLKSRPRWQLSDLVRRLLDESGRLPELKMEDQAVRTIFGLSWEALDETLCRAFSLLAVFAGRSFTAEAFTAVSQMEAGTAADSLYSLVALSLLEEEGDRHYRQHPLLADFAAEQLANSEVEPAADERMAHFYLAYAQEHQKAYLVLEEEWDNLLAAIETAHERQWWQVIIDYSDVLTEAWFARSRFTDARQGFRWAVEAAEAIGNQSALAETLRHWGKASLEQGDYVEALEHLTRSLALCRDLDDQSGIADNLDILGRTAFEQANIKEAQKLLQESRKIRERLGDNFGLGRTISFLAEIEYNYRHYDEAWQLSKQAQAIQETAEDKVGLLHTIRQLANIALHGMDDSLLAENFGQKAIALGEELQYKDELAMAHSEMSKVYLAKGDLAAAREHAEKGMKLFEGMGDRRSLALALFRFSQIEAELDAHDSALQTSRRGLELIRGLGDNWGTIFIQQQVGDVLNAMGRPEEARQEWSEAKTLAEPLNHPLTASLKARLEIEY